MDVSKRSTRQSHKWQLCFFLLLILVSSKLILSEAQSSESDEDADGVDLAQFPYCSEGVQRKICVPKELCVNGKINHIGKNIFSPRIGEDFDECGNLGKTCCEVSSNVRLPTQPTITTTTPVPTPDVSPDYGWTGQCGQRAVEASTVGSETNRWEFPWSVALFYTVIKFGAERLVFLCGGTLIDDQVVLTAADCVHQHQNSILKVHIGRWQIDVDNDSYVQKIGVEKVEIHSSYSPSNHVGNIALLFLSDSAQTSSAVNRVCLPANSAPNFRETNQNPLCYVVGWTFKKVDGLNRLLKLEATIADRHECMVSIHRSTGNTRFQLPKEHLCADYTKDSVPCERTTGSGMFCTLHEGTEQFFLVGIASYSLRNCDQFKAKDVFQSTQHYIAWIDERMMNHSRSTTYYRPDPVDDLA